MIYLILLVLHETVCLDEVLIAWEECQVNGVTILPSTGLARLRQKTALREDLPLIPSIEDIFQHVEDSSRTLFTVVQSEEMVDKVVAATQNITGDLNLPNTGILVVLPVVRAYGLDRSPSDVVKK
jgi:nitrogen regulatory protein P-II 1